jgi:hypothetical protein
MVGAAILNTEGSHFWSKVPHLPVSFLVRTTSSIGIKEHSDSPWCLDPSPPYSLP